jgi:hypothetical protein
MAGIPVVAAEVGSDWGTAVIRLFGMPGRSLLFCVGVMSFLVGLNLWMKESPGLRQPDNIRPRFFSGLSVVLAVPVLTYGLLLIAHLARWISWLEFTLEFMVALVVSALAVSVVIVTSGHIATERAGPLRARLVRALGFLASRHPTGSLRRFVRIMLIGFLGWGWWNLIVAPALYGNFLARKYLSARVSEFYSQEQEGDPFLQTFFVVPATALEKNEERYFLFYPRSIEHLLRKDVRRHLARDPRWTLTPEPSLRSMSPVVFASGSPFPIFPPHKLDAGDRGPEWLIDGGFAHDVPVEAVEQVGARQILILESSPFKPIGPRPAKYEPHKRFLSQLALNVPRLIPFLYKRSQMADVLSREDLMVAMVYPTGTPDWPILVDFRGERVRQMTVEATRDLPRRVGVFESWGSPRFHRTLLDGRMLE